MELRILISGTGGQGIVAAGEFLSEALFGAGYEVVNTRSYGPEARGGSCRSEVVVSDGEIYDLELGEADILIAMSLQAYRRYRNQAKENSLLIIDTDVLRELREGEVRKDVRLAPIPAAEKAAMLGNPIVANMVILGSLAKASGLMTLDGLRGSVRALMRPSLQEINLKALELGYSLA